jgi:hypothetical protein
MTFAELQVLTSTWLDDLNNGYFTLPQVKRWLNNAQKETQKLLIQSGENRYVVCAETTLVQNQGCYILPQNFLKVRRLEIVKNAGTVAETKNMIEPISMNEQDLVANGQGQPNVYFLTKNKIHLFPSPDTTYTMRLHYSYRVIDMASDNEVPDVPEEYHEFLAVLATIDGLLRDRRDTTAMLEKRTYYQDMLKKDAENRHVDRPRRVVITETDSIWSYE